MTSESNFGSFPTKYKVSTYAPKKLRTDDSKQTKRKVYTAVCAV